MGLRQCIMQHGEIFSQNCLTNQDCIKMVVGNKVEKESERIVSRKEGIDFSREYGCLFIECNAKTKVSVQQCFEELVLKALETLNLLAEA